MYVYIYIYIYIHTHIYVIGVKYNSKNSRIVFHMISSTSGGIVGESFCVLKILGLK